MIGNHSLKDVLKAVTTIVGVPLVLFALAQIFFEQPGVALAAAVITAIMLSVWIIQSSWTGGTEVIIGWLILAVVVLAGFVFWPKTMTIEGVVVEGADVPVSNEEIVLVDDHGIAHEAQTNADGHYQFENVPYGTYKIRVREQEVGGAAGGILPVSKVVVNITAPTLIPPTDTPTPSPTPTDTPTPPHTPTDTPTPSLTPTPECWYSILLNYSDLGGIGESVNFPITSEGLNVDISNDINGSGVFFKFDPALDVRGFTRLELSGTSDQALTFLVEYKVLDAENQPEIVTTSSQQSFSGNYLSQTIKIPLQYDGKINELVINIPIEDEASRLLINSICLMK